jgi:hypothetical protein
MATAKTVTQSAAELAKEARESVEGLRRSVGQKLDDARGETGAALHTAAASVRTTGHQGAAAIDELATGTADRLDATGYFIEEHELRDALTGLRRFGRRHLAGSLVAAAAFGFLAGAAIRKAPHHCAKVQRAT